VKAAFATLDLDVLTHVAQAGDRPDLDLHGDADVIDALRQEQCFSGIIHR
jgi:hypothetical protein